MLFPCLSPPAGSWERCAFKTIAPEKREAAECWFCLGWEHPASGSRSQSGVCSWPDVTCQSLLEDLNVPICHLQGQWQGQTQPVLHAGSCPFPRVRSIPRQSDGVLWSRKYRFPSDTEVQHIVTETLVSRSPWPSGMFDISLTAGILLHFKDIQFIIMPSCAFGPSTWIKKIQARWDLLILKNASR